MFVFTNTNLTEKKGYVNKRGKTLRCGEKASAKAQHFVERTESEVRYICIDYKPEFY